MKIFISNLSFRTGAAELHELFSAYGTVTSIQMMEDRMGNLRGFGFIEMSSQQETEKAIAALNRKEFEGRVLSVFIARENPGGRGEGRGHNTNRPYRKREYHNPSE